MRGTDLGNADLEGATLEMAMLQGANMTRCPDQGGRSPWRRRLADAAAAPDATGLGRLHGLVMRAITDADNVALKSDLGRIERPRLRARNRDRDAAACSTTDTVQGWSGSAQTTSNGRR